MRKIIFCLLLVVSVFMSNLGYAQGVVVRVNGEVVQQMGNVSDEKKESKKEQEKRITVSGTVTCQGEPVYAVAVKIKDAGQAPIYTNMNGEYKISIPENGATLDFSGLTLKTKYVEVKDQGVVDVVMDEEPQKYDNYRTGPLAKNMTVVTGYVTWGGEPVTGASVRVKGKKIYTFTKWNGKYSIVVPKNSTLVYSFVGDDVIKEKVKGRSRIDVQLSGIMTFDDRDFNRSIKRARRSKK